MNDLINDLIYNKGYVYQYIVLVLYFVFLYFFLGLVFLNICKLLTKWGWAHKMSNQKVSNSQYLKEKKNSSISILIFSFTAVFLIYFIQISWIKLAENTLLNLIIGLIVLNVWNEIHFFIIHKILHTPFLLKNVHKVHHQSVVPTVYSAFSFHWFEAFLLSTVTITIAPFFNFSLYAILLYPLNSILLNFAGHSNYKLKQNFITKYFSWRFINHNYHHTKFNKNYGFVTDIMDKISNWLKSKSIKTH